MENEELVRYIRMASGEQQNRLKYELYEQNLGFIRNVARKWQGLAEMDDLLQESYLAIDKAVELYDEEQGAFLTYAAYWIESYVSRYALKQAGIPINMADNVYKYQRCISDFEKNHGRTPTRAELAELLELSPVQIDNIQKAVSKQYPLSIDQPAPGQDDNGTLAEIVADGTDQEAQTTDKLFFESAGEIIWRCVAELDPEERTVIDGRYREGMNRGKMAKALNMSIREVRNIENRALNVLRRNEELLRLCEREEELEALSYRGTGLNAFRELGLSSVERVAFKRLDETENKHLAKVRRQYARMEMKERLRKMYEESQSQTDDRKVL